jgi:hypothetical protein
MDAGPRGRGMLTAAALATGLAGLAHVACVAWGADGYRFLGAGEAMAQLALAGDPYPARITLAIAGVLGVWSAYALSAAGRVGRLPLLRTVLVAVTAVFVLRALAFPALRAAFPGNSLGFWLWSSAICLGIGLLYLGGLVRAWPRLRPPR